MAAMNRRVIARVPLVRALSKLGAASRTEAARLIGEGRVTVSGRVVTDARHLVHPERTPIAIDGHAIARAARLTILLHKPRGVLTTRSDPAGRPTVYDFIRDVRAAAAAAGAGAGADARAAVRASADAAAHLVPVGRLDMASTGLLLFTNDTRLAHWLTDPATKIVRVYLVTVRGQLEDDAAIQIERGVIIDSERLSAKRVTVRKRSARETHLVVELVEGKNREIRRLMQATGHEVRRLARVTFGGLELGALAPGKWRVISEAELARLFPSAPPPR
jgi:23S rRNA pseudouridine2605 synthase